MNKRKPEMRIALSIMLSVLLAACGGGSSGSAPPGGLGKENTEGDVNIGGGPSFKDYALQYGMNSSRLGYSYRSIVFSDLMMQSSEFGEFNGAIIDLTKQTPTIPYGQGLIGEGWPDLSSLTAGTVVGSRLLNSMEGSMPDGRNIPYVLEWSGTGSCRLHGEGVLGESNRTSNRVEVFIDPRVVAGVDPSLGILIDSSNANDPVRNIHIWLPGTETARPLFWPDHLDKVMAMNQNLGPYVWRSMDWTQVFNYGQTESNGAFTFNLESRVTPRSPSQSTKQGMCVEMIVAYANAIQRDVILNLPHRTDDLTESEYADFLMDVFDRAANGSPAVPGINGGQAFAGLDSNLTLWIELSNEIWNSGFAVNAWMKKEANAKGITYEEQVADEIATMNAAAQAVFSAPGDKRLKLYVAGYIIDPDSMQEILDFLPSGTQVDAIGPAFYFSEQSSDIDTWLENSDPATGSCPNCPSTEELIAAGRASIPVLASFIADHKSIADSTINPDGSSPLLMLYEAGQHFVAGTFPWGNEVNQAQLHPDMYYAYVDDLIPAMVNEGVDIVCWFDFMTNQDPTPRGALGPFGIWNSMDQQITLPVPETYVDEQAPKAAAIYKAPPKLP